MFEQIKLVEGTDEMQDSPTCNCNLCRNNRRFKKIANKLSNEDKKWLERFGRDHLHMVEDYEYTSILLRGLKIKSDVELNGLSEAIDLIKFPIIEIDNNESTIPLAGKINSNNKLEVYALNKKFMDNNKLIKLGEIEFKEVGQDAVEWAKQEIKKLKDNNS